MHLIECFMPVVAYLSHFQRDAEEIAKGVEQVHGELVALLRQGEDLAQEHLIPDRSYQDARFAICAFADEVVLNSCWDQRAGWLKTELQRHYYRTSDAGVEFFDRLDRLPHHEEEVREVYYLCLALGFTGRYCAPGGEAALMQLREAQLRILTGGTGSRILEGRNLFPGGYPQDLPAKKDVGRTSFATFPALLALFLPLLLFAVLFSAFRFALDGLAENLLKSVPY